MDYDKYRKHIEELNFLKKNLLDIINEKKITYTLYRNNYKKFKELKNKENIIRDKLIDMI
jgi:hypothetical protein